MLFYKLNSPYSVQIIGNKYISLPIYSIFTLNKNIAITNKEKYSNLINTHFVKKETFTTNSLVDLFRQNEPDIERTTINWRIYQLVKDGIIQRISKGKFTLGNTKSFIPETNETLVKLAEKIKTDFPFAKFCLWETSIINGLTQHHVKENMTVLEAEKEVTDSLFYSLNDDDEYRKKGIYVRVNTELMEKYVSNNENPLVIRDLITEAPLQNTAQYNTVTIEKLLVDLYTDIEIFQAYQGNELTHIFKNAYQKYTINESKLLRYASRRGKKDEISTYINQIIGNK